MDFQLLGPFHASHEGRQILADNRRQERCLLALLLLRAPRAVTTARLINLLWNGEAPASARGTVHTYVGRLRARLTPYGVQLATRQDGYAVEPGEHTVDAEEFRRLVRQAETAGEPAERLRCYDEALALWQGPLLADVADDVLRDRVGGHLTELRLTALEQRAETQLALGLHDRAAAELRGPAQRHPEREGLVAARMTALYRSDRQAEALALYRDTRGALVEGFGVEPGPGLRRLHDRVLQGDPRLERRAAPVHAVRVRGEWLPWSTSGHPALEFCNTYAGWGGPPMPGSEWLRGYSSLAVWTGHLGLADDHLVDRLLRQAGERPDEAAVLREAREFRRSLYVCLTDPQNRTAFPHVARVVEEAAAHAEFALGTDGLATWRAAPSAGLRLPLHAVAHSAAALLADPRRLTVRACPGPDCGWLFLDDGGRRRWCHVSTCGPARRRPQPTCATG
jgi:DNA-binding SARP family transcriptional activator/predicted RNA-binding Zn ribbon-like protein